MVAGVRLALTLLVVTAFLALAVVVGVWDPANEADALPPAGQDLLNVSGEASIASRLGQETIAFEGLVTFAREDPHMDGEVEVVDIEIIGLNLVGESITGPISVSLSQTFQSTGEIRSLQPPPDQFPASVTFDLFIEIGIPVSGGSAPVVHNEIPLALAAVSPIAAWPPVGAQFHAEPEAPEGSHCVAPDGPGGLPLLPLLPAEVCMTSVSMTIGAPKTPTATLTPCPAEVCTPTPSPLPQDTTVPANTPGPTSTPTTTPSPTPTPGPTCVSVTSSDDVFSQVFAVPLEIPDGTEAGVGACMLISQSLTVEDLNVRIGISHDWVGDLVVRLIHEDTGTSITLIDRPGVGPNEPGVGCGGRDVDVILDDQADRAVEDACDDRPAISGRLYPNQPLSAFDGESLLGAWIISVVDPDFIADGTLDEWSLMVNEADVLVGDASCDGVVNAIDSTLILQVGAGLLGALPCPQGGDVNGDGVSNALDSALILQFGAGLIGQLPP